MTAWKVPDAPEGFHLTFKYLRHQEGYLAQLGEIALFTTFGEDKKIRADVFPVADPATISAHFEDDSSSLPTAAVQPRLPAAGCSANSVRMLLDPMGAATGGTTSTTRLSLSAWYYRLVGYHHGHTAYG